MKKITAVLISIIIIFNVNPRLTEASGSGTSDNPIIIKTAEDFNAIRNNPSLHYRLEADIELNSLYEPFAFGGALEGGSSDKLYSVTVNIDGYSSYTSPVGLFSFLKSNAAIKNICLKGSISGEAYVGGFFGRCENGAQNITVENCVNEAEIRAKGNFAGGICAAAEAGVNIVNSVNKGSIYANNSAGGIGGEVYNVKNSSNCGYVYCENDYAGGIAGSANGEIYGAVNSGEISSGAYCGGIAGVAGKKAVIENSVNTGLVNGRNNSAVCGSGGIAGGIKRLADVSLEIKSCINYTAVQNGFNPIYASYIEYDKTNFITAENSWYLSDSGKDDGKQGTEPFMKSDSKNVMAKLPDAFSESSDSYILPKATQYFAYEKKEEPQDTVLPYEPPVLSEEAGVLKALGILSGDFNPDAILTRGEFADLIIKALYNSMSFSEKGNINSFTDVSEDYEYYDAVIAVKELGIMYAGGYNRFYPEREITGNEAITALIRALSYEGYALNLGEYPTGYVLAGKNIGLADNFNDFNGKLTADNGARLIYNALTTTTLYAEYKDSDSVILRPDYGKSFLKDFYKINKYDAVLTNDGVISLDNSGILGDDLKVALTLYESGETIIVNAPEEIKRSLGMRLNAYVKEDGISDKEIIYFKPHKDNEITVVFGEDITALKSDYIAYEKKEEGKEYNIYFENGKYPNVLINGEAAINYTLADISSDNAVLNFIDNDADKRADTIIINDYFSETVAGTVDAEEKTVYAMEGTYTNLRAGADNTVIRFAPESVITDFGAIAKGDVILAAKSSKLIGGKTLMILNVSRNTLAGTLEATGDNSVYLNGTEYRISAHLLKSDSKYMSKLQSGAPVKLYLNSFERVAYIEKSIGLDKNYAFILAAGMNNSFNPKASVRLINVLGDIAEFTLAEKLTEGHGRIKVSDLPEFVNRLSATKDSLIVYELNSNGEIANITFAEAASSNFAENKGRFTLQKHVTSASVYSGMTLGGVCADNTLVFVVPVNFNPDGTDSRVSNKYFVRTNQYSNVKFYDVGADGTATVALHMPASASGAYDTIPEEMMLFTRKTTAVGPTGDILTKLYYMKNGEEQSIFVSNEAEYIEMNNNSFTTDTLEAGDIIICETDISGIAKKISLLFDCDKFGSSADGLVYIGGTGTGNNKATTIFEGEVQYVSEAEITLRLPTAAYNVEKFTGVSAGHVYKVDRTKNTVRNGSFSDLNTTDFSLGAAGDTVTVTANRNRLIEVIIYE